MLRANRRHRLLYLALAAMEVAGSLPFVHFLLRPPPAQGAQTALLLFACFYATFLFFMLAADLLNRRAVDSPAREIVLLLVVTGTAPAMAWLLAYSPIAPLGTTVRGFWLVDLGQGLVNFTAGLRPGPLVLGYTLFLWWRVAAMTSRDMGFFAVGLSFRFGLLLALLGNGLLSLRTLDTDANVPSAPAVYLFLFVGAGLTATALARIDDKAFLADRSSGALLPWGRFAQILAGVAATLGLSALVAAVYSPRGFSAFFGLFAPFTGVLGTVLQWAVAALLWLLMPLFNLLERLILRLTSGAEPLPPVPLDAALPSEYTSFTRLVSESPLLRYCLVGLALLVGAGLIALFFARTLAALRRDEPEEDTPAPLEIEAGGGPRTRRRGLWGLARRYGLGRRLLAAISVQNLYANVCRLARRRGQPPPPAQPPVAYLPRLESALPGHAAALARLTDAYMRVHYGDEPASPEELAQLRRDYEAIRTTPAPAPT